MKRSCLIGLSILLVFLLFPQYVKAEYLLPYPSFMPGNKLYRVSMLFDKLEAFWYWGNIASIKYHLKLADKYLVEAKTLFEYKQYLLAVDALKRSNRQFRLVPSFMQKAVSQGKDTSNLQLSQSQAAQAHIQVLEKLQNELPYEFLWTPEKEAPTKLDLSKMLAEAIAIRKDLAR